MCVCVSVGCGLPPALLVSTDKLMIRWNCSLIRCWQSLKRSTRVCNDHQLQSDIGIRRFAVPAARPYGGPLLIATVVLTAAETPSRYKERHLFPFLNVLLSCDSYWEKLNRKKSNFCSVHKIEKNPSSRTLWKSQRVSEFGLFKKKKNQLFSPGSVHRTSQVLFFFVMK